MQLSAYRTWEGFAGASLMTIVFGYDFNIRLSCAWFSRDSLMIVQLHSAVLVGEVCSLAVSSASSFRQPN